MPEPAPEPIPPADVGTKYNYFEYDGLPGREPVTDSTLAADRHPEVYRAGKGWEPIDPIDFFVGHLPIDEACFKEMMATQHDAGPSPAPDA